MLTVREVAQLLNIHPNTLKRWSKTGRIRAYRITPRGDRRFTYEEIVRFLAELNANTGHCEEAESREPGEVNGQANGQANLPLQVRIWQRNDK